MDCGAVQRLRVSSQPELTCLHTFSGWLEDLEPVPGLKVRSPDIGRGGQDYLHVLLMVRCDISSDCRFSCRLLVL